MLSHEPRCIFSRNLLSDVMCQLRFPEILTISQTPPAAFQEAIRDEFPIYSSRMEVPMPKISGMPGNMRLEDQPSTVNYCFASEDGTWRVNVTSKYISLACNRYTSWEEFASMLDKPLAAFIQIYRPAYFERVGLRYLNFISRKALGIPNVPYNQLIQPQYLGLLGDDDVNENATTRATVDAELAIRGGCRAKIHAGPGLVKKPGQNDPEPKFILDLDLYMMGNVAVNLSAGCLQTLHAQAYSLFRGAITDTLHDAMEPKNL